MPTIWRPISQVPKRGSHVIAVEEIPNLDQQKRFSSSHLQDPQKQTISADNLLSLRVIL